MDFHTYIEHLARFKERSPDDWRWFEFRPIKLPHLPWIPPLNFFADAITQQGFKYANAQNLHAKLANGLTWSDTVAISEIPEQILVDEGKTRKKAMTLKDVAKVLSGFSDEQVRAMSSDQVMKTFGAVKGIGKWTLQYWLTHYFHELIVFSEDRLIFIGLEAMLSLPKRPTAKQAEKICKERWGDLEEASP